MLRTRRWLFWEPWESAVNPVRLSGGVWSFELKVSDNQGNSDYRTVYLWPVAVSKTLYVLLALLLVGIGAFLSHRRKVRS
jgi:hypothetical protein